MNTIKDYGNFGPMSSSKKKKHITLKRGVFFGLIILLLAALVGAGFLWYKKNQSPEELSQKQTEKLLEEMSRFVLLPDEIPAVFTISDIDTLVQQQPFFTGAQNGDVLFVFPQAVKAVVYSPDRKRIINMGPVTGTGSENSQISQQISAPAQRTGEIISNEDIEAPVE